MNHISSPQVTDESIERILQNHSKAPRVTLDDLRKNIVGEHYFTAADGAAGAGRVVAREFYHENGHAIVDYSEHTCVGPLTKEKGYTPHPLVYQAIPTGPLALLTFCVLVLQNGFTVTGESACASPENYDAEIGRRIARENAVQKIWALMGYALKERLAA
jgi:hypothetical protein